MKACTRRTLLLVLLLAAIISAALAMRRHGANRDIHLGGGEAPADSDVVLLGPDPLFA